MNKLFDKNMVKMFENIFGIILVVVIIISSISSFMEFRQEQAVFLSDSSYIMLILGFIACIFLGIANNLFLVVIFVAFKLSSRASYKKILDETDFEKNKNYFRDIIKKYSISELNYIDEFKLDKKQSFTAKLLELEKKRIIKIENGKISKINKPDNILDVLFVNSINNNKVTMTLSEYEDLVEDKAIDDGLITKANVFERFKDKKMLVIMTIIFTLITLYLFWVAYINGNEDLEITIFISIFWIVFVIVHVCIFRIVFRKLYYTKNALFNKYKRTDTGKQINLQLDGLKLFMKKFSNIEKKEAKHLVLWDEYLIYSVMFNINKEIQEEYSKYFD